MTDPLAPLWRVTAQRPDVDVGVDGQLVRGTRVSFVTARGVGGSVFVPDAQYQLEYVRMVINDAAARMDQVQGLTGG